MALRSAYREWNFYLHGVASDTFDGYRHQPADAVAERIDALRATAQAASDALMRDGWWVGSERAAMEIASLQVLNLVHGANAEPAGEDARIELRPAFDRADESRHMLNEEILDRLARIAGEALQISREG